MNLTRKHLSVCVSGVSPLCFLHMDCCSLFLYCWQPAKTPPPLFSEFSPYSFPVPWIIYIIPVLRTIRQFCPVFLRAVPGTFIGESQPANAASKRPQSDNLRGFRERSHRRGPGAAPLGGGGEIGGTRAILEIENTNKYVAINMQLMYNFAEIYEN